MFRDNGEYGVKYLNFEDADGNTCLLADSLEFSVEHAVLRFGRGDKMMYLNREQVKQIIPRLENFVKTGEL